MTSMPSLPDPAPVPMPGPAPMPADDDRALRLPAHCTTVTAEDFHVRLVLAADFDGRVEIDASQVESIGQATLQLLVAARVEAEGNGQRFAIVDPSPAFVARVTGCRLADAVGLVSEKDELQ